MNTIPTPAPPARVDAAKRSGPPPGTAEPGDFAALLDQTTARTAPAEGPKTHPAPERTTRGAGRRDQDREARRDDDQVSAGVEDAAGAAAAQDAQRPAQPRRADDADRDGDVPAES